jgi:GNAT superfamily N-acetyltransferase
MTRAEVDFAVEWAALEGWNPGLHDADCFYRADPEGFFIGLLEGEPVGSISAVAYGQSYGFMGFYIVKPDYRKHGYGIRLWNEAIKHLTGRNIGLDGVIAQQDNYKKSGFKLAYRNIRYQWEASHNKSATGQVVELSEIPGEILAAYDTEMFGVERSLFLDCWVSRPETRGLGIVRDGKILGYGVLRACRNGYKIGPLFANAPDLAENLFLSLTTDVLEGSPVFLDVPEVNSDAVRMAEAYGMTKVFETARMYTQAEPSVPLHRWFGVTTFELG